jgi:hypothetical protein
MQKVVAYDAQEDTRLGGKKKEILRVPPTTALAQLKAFFGLSPILRSS